MEDIRRKVYAVQRRLAFLAMLDLSLRTLFFALLAAMVLVAATKFFHEDFDPLVVSAALVGVAVGVSAVWAWARRLSPFEAAVRADGVLALRERISSAFILGDRAATDPAVAALAEDAARFARGIDTARDFRFKAPPHAKFLALPFAAILGLHYFVGDFDLFGNKPVESKPATNAVKEETLRKIQAEQIRKLAESAKEASLQEDDQLARISRNLERLSRDVSLGTKDRKSAAAEMSRMADDIRMEKRQIERSQEPFKSLTGLNRSPQTRDLRSELKDQDFTGASRQLERLADKMEGMESMSSEDLKELAEELRDLAEQTKGDPQSSQAFADAAKAVQQAAEQAARQNQQNQQQSAGSQQGDQQGNQGQQQQQSGQPTAESSMPGIQAAQALRQAAQAMNNQAEAKQMVARLDQFQQQQQQQQQQSGQSGKQGQPNQQGQGQQGQNQQGRQQGQQGQGQQGAQSQPGQQGQQQGGNSSQQQNGGPQQGDGQQGQSGQQSSQSSGQQSTAQSGQTIGGKPCSNCGSSQCQGGSQCQNGGQGQQPGSNGQGQWNSQMNPNEGAGSGGGGIGRGGRPPDDGSTALGFTDTFIPGEKKGGEIIAVIQIDAPAPVGESNVQYQNVFNSYQQKASDTLKNDVIPATYRSAVRDYFRAINPEQRPKQ